MPKLDKICISGIRAFNPNDVNVVEFNTPLTLIVGPNGSGKTSIIECLKYLTTGDLPPNSKGGAFVFDPHLVNEIDSKGEIKLKFINCHNEVIVCTRSMQVSRKNSKLTQKTLETSLVKEEHGKTTIISTKLAEVDKEIPQFFSSSKSILDNVIFCHQEESTWPLSDPKTLKDKLDEIFDATKYLKALKSFKDSKKMINSDIKLKEQELSFIYKDKSKRDELIRNLESLEENISNKTRTQEGYLEDLNRITNIMGNFKKEILIYEQLEKNYRVLKGEFDTCISYIKNFCYEILDPEIFKEKDFGKMIIEEKIKEINLRLKETDLDNLDSEFNKLEILKKHYEDFERSRASYTSTLDDLIKKKNKLNSEKSFIVSELSAEFGCKEDEIVDKVSQVFKKVADSLNSQKEEIRRENEKIILMKNDVKEIEALKQQNLSFLAETKHLIINDQIDITEVVQIDYEKKMNLEADLDEILEDYSEKQEFLNKSYLLSAESAKKEDINSQIIKINKYIESQDVLKMKELIAKKYKDLEKAKIDLKVVNQRKTETLINIENSKNQRIKLIAEISYYCNKLSIDLPQDTSNFFIPSHIFEEEQLKDLDKYTQDLEKTKHKLSSSYNSSATYENLLKKAQKEMACPLCKKSFCNQEDKVFSQRLEGIINTIPETIGTLEVKKKQLLETIKSIEEENIVIEKRNQNKRKLKELYGDYKDLHKRVMILEEQENGFNVGELCPLIYEQSILKIEGELKEIQRQIDYNDRMLVELKKLMEERANLSDDCPDITNLKVSLDKLKDCINIKREEFKRYCSTVKDLENKKKIIEEEMTKRTLIEKRDGILKKISAVPDYKDLEIAFNTKSLKFEKTSSEYMKRRLDVEFKLKKIEEMNSNIVETNNHINELEFKLKSSENFNKEYVFMDRKSNNLVELYDYARRFVTDKKQVYIEQNKEVESLKVRLKIIDENIKLIECKSRVLKIEEEFKDVNFRKLDALKTKFVEYEEKKRKISTAQSILVGELKQLNATVDMHKKDLEKNYKDVNNLYIKTAVEMKALEMSLSDIDKCVNALDKAIVDFHGTKLDELNNYLRDLWSNTYKGDDIDYIEIKAETSDTKAYNYSVMMVKNGISMEMRGRCSAGQKMIASILIRLALSDTFSSGCNILALDEPTTNLDRDNIESLALTLSRIIKERVNSQIIIITHDEEFVELINREGIDYFYRLRRDSKGFSHIERHSIYK